MGVQISPYLVDVSEFFFLFCGMGREEAFEEVVGGEGRFNKNRERGGGVSRRRRGIGKGAEGMPLGKGGGLNICFSGPKRPPSLD